MTETITLPKTPSFRLDGRRALITGAGRGIGLAFAAALALQGVLLAVLLSRRVGSRGGFVRTVSITGGIVGLVATLWTFFPVLALPLCR